MTTANPKLGHFGLGPRAQIPTCLDVLHDRVFFQPAKRTYTARENNQLRIEA